MRVKTYTLLVPVKVRKQVLPVGGLVVELKREGETMIVHTEVFGKHYNFRIPVTDLAPCENSFEFREEFLAKELKKLSKMTPA